MSRFGWGLVRVLIGSLATVLLLASPARADLVTLNFQGQVDFTPEGGALYAYSGFVRWDSAAAPFKFDPSEGNSYALIDYQLIFDGVDVSSAPNPLGTGNRIVVTNNIALATVSNSPLDAFGFFLGIGRPYDPTGDVVMWALILGPTTMLNSGALPSSLDFLNQPRTAVTAWFFVPDGAGEDGKSVLPPLGTLKVVPEPATLALTALGLAGALTRRRSDR